LRAGRPARALARVAAQAWRAWATTLRVAVELADGTRVRGSRLETPGDVYALREGDLLALCGLVPGRRVAVLVAHGRDGDLATAAAETLGCRVVRGSSRHGGARALRQIVRDLRGTDHPLALVVDGPLGPAGVAKPGVLACGRWLGRRIHPVAAAAAPRLLLSRTWSGTYVPMPGARVAIAFEAPMEVAPDEREVEPLRAELTRRIGSAARRAEAML
jgi:lysophospholipid acyltransferase (LPLAT)-like uncharacterized protein